MTCWTDPRGRCKPPGFQNERRRVQTRVASSFTAHSGQRCGGSRNSGRIGSGAKSSTGAVLHFEMCFSTAAIQTAELVLSFPFPVELRTRYPAAPGNDRELKGSPSYASLAHGQSGDYIEICAGLRSEHNSPCATNSLDR